MRTLSNSVASRTRLPVSPVAPAVSANPAVDLSSTCLTQAKVVPALYGVTSGTRTWRPPV